MKKVTLKDIAQAVGISEMTASRALRGHRDVSDRTRKLVQKKAEEFGYTPNKAASMLASKSSKLIPMIVPSLRNTVFLDVISAAQEVINNNGYQLMLMNTDYCLKKETEAVSQVLAWSPAAAIITGVNHAKETIQLLSDVDFPVVEVMDVCPDPIDICVGFSHTQAGREMGEHLISKGYTSFAFCCSFLENDIRGRKRFEGFKAAVMAAGFPEPRVVDIGMRVADMQRECVLEKFIARYAGCDCVYFHNDDLAVAMLLTLQRLRINVPSELAIAGFNDLVTSRFTHPRLTTSRSPRRRIGKIAAESALKRIRGENLEANVIDLGCKLITGQSV